MDTSLRSILAAAGTPDDLIAYVEARGIVSPEIYAELGDDVKEFDQAMVDSLASLVKLPDGKVFEVTATDLSVVRARLRHAWSLEPRLRPEVRLLLRRLRPRPKSSLLAIGKHKFANTRQ